MVGFTFFHTYGILFILASLLLLIITITILVQIIINLFKKINIERKHILIVIISLCVFALNFIIPYTHRYAQSLMIRHYGLPKKAISFFQDKALEGDLGNMKLLLEHGLTADTFVFRGPLYNACYYGRINVIEFSLQNGADINDQSGDSKTSPSMYAAELGQTKTVKYLLEHGANPVLKNKDGKIALDIAISYSKQEVVEVFSNYLKK
jgi:hypothetical protein